MKLQDALSRLPEEFEVVRGRCGVLAVRRERRGALLAAGFGPDDRPRAEVADLTGRRPLGTLSDGETRLLVREFHHGGLLRAFSGRRFLDPARPFEELILADALRARGILSPEVVAARAVRASTLGWELALVTVRVEGARDGMEAIEAWRTRPRSPRASRLVDALGAFLGRLHAVGLHHVDLHPANLLVREEADGFQLWVLDLDRSSLRPALSEEERHLVLGRFLRYLARRQDRSGAVLSGRVLARFLRAYRRGLDGSAARRGAWRREWLALAPTAARPALRHRFGWALEDLLAGRSAD